MDRLFLDANVLFSAAYGRHAGLARFWKMKDVTLCSSRYAVEEARVNLKEVAQKRRLAAMAKALELVEVDASAAQMEVSLPEKDQPILQAAIAARATHLITGDLRHFGRYIGKTLGGVTVMTPSGYVKARGLI